MRKAIYLSEAVRGVIVAVAVLLILTIWPLRIWQRIIVERGGGVRMEVSDQVDDAHDLIQDFIAQYDRLEAVDVYVEEVSVGRYMNVTVFDSGMAEIFHKYLDVGEARIPGRVRIPLGLDLKVGESYRIFLMGVYSGYRLGLQNIPEGASPYFTGFYMGDSGAPEWRLDMELRYEQPLDRRTSLLLMAVVAVLALLAERSVAILAKRGDRDRERIVTVGETLRGTLAPVFGAFLLVMVSLVLLQRFDYRLTDNAFYLCGWLLLGLMGAAFFVPGDETAGVRRERGIITTVIEMFQAVAFAMAMQGACEYMNGLYDIDHAVAARKETIWLSVFLLLFLLGRRQGEKRRIRLNPLGFLALLFFALLVLYRNNRPWVVTLALLFVLGLFCYRFSPRRERWLPLLAAGIFLHFGASVWYSLTSRYFVAFVDARFPFIFHTVTVTAEYLTIVGAAAFALLLAAVLGLRRDAPFKEALREVRGPAVLFGAVSSYLLFTCSRTGILAVAGAVLILLPVVGLRGRSAERKQRRGIRTALLVSVLAFLISFPVVFTLQRSIPVMVGRPQFMVIENIDPNLKGAVNWDSMFLMSVERFRQVFLEKVAGIEGIAYNYPEDRFNYDANGDLLYPRVDGEVQKQVMPMAKGDWVTPIPEEGEEEEEPEEQGSIEQMANGRLTIWRSYLPSFNLTGHEEMGEPLPNGEIAVHAHNVYLQVIHDHGLIVGILFAALILLCGVAGAVYGRMPGEDGGAGGPDGIRFLPAALTIGFAAAGIPEWNFHLGNMMTLAMLASWIPLCFRGVGSKR